MKVCRVQEMRDMDRSAIEHLGIPAEILMENAGLACCQVLQREIGIRGRRFAVVCGGGNNGGDGLVIARKIHSAGGRVRVFLLGSPDRMKGAAGANLSIARSLGLPIERVGPNGSPEQGSPEQDSHVHISFERELAACDVVVDAVFGTGLAREVEGRYAEVIALINRAGRSGAAVLSVDIPSGVNGDTGRIMGTAVSADMTVTFGLPKLGNLLHPGCCLGGRLYVTHISFPPALYDSDDLRIAVSTPPPLPNRREDGHKGSFGDVLFVAGAESYYGAPQFSARSFLRAGGGYARLACPRSLAPVVAASAPEIVFHPQPETESGSLAGAAAAGILELASRSDAVVIGPGLSRHEETAGLVRRVAAEVAAPLLIDGDGLTAVSREPDLLARRTGPTVLTPHPGEMAGLTGMTVAEVLARKVDVVQEHARRWGSYIVLKGAHSLVGCPDGRLFINPSGNSGMGTAGSGDVLNGAMAAMLGLGLPLEGAVLAGVFVHGLAGDIAAEEEGEDRLTAVSIMEALPAAVRRYRSGHEALFADLYGLAREV